MLEPMFLWVTRTAPYHLLTAHRLRGIGHSALAVPALEVRAAPHGSPRRRPDALAFTSAHAVRHHRFRPGWSELPVFAVGHHSAGAARRAGYRNVRSADGDVADLQKLIVTTLPRPAAIIHFSASEPAGDLTGYLKQSGYDAQRIIVYESRPSSDAALETVLAAMPRLDGIVIHSPKGARRIAQVIAGCGWYGMVFCLSRACARELSHLPALLVETSAKPTEESLMNLLRLYRGPPGPRRRSWSPDPGALPAFLRNMPASPAGRIANDNIAQPAVRRVPFNRGYPDDPDDPPPTAA